MVARVLLFNKPYGVLSQFTSSGNRRGLGDFIAAPGLYPAGRLDADSEGLLVLTDDGRLQQRIANPRHKLLKRYWVQVEGVPDERVLARLATGVELADGMTRPCGVRRIEQPDELWDRCPPIRARRSIPASWIEIGLREGRNRQVRRMTARLGFPTLRLVRVAIGPWRLSGMPPGAWREVPPVLDPLASQACSG